ncbi:MAG TPA: hypothetical protein VMY80_15185 [Anaerolineae bacterium]|nr:hypothetical protein [Anaerolineae bacterium]
MIRTSRWWATALLVALGCSVGALYLVAAFAAAQGRAVAPLDDAYITFQYARQIARGHPYLYNDGDLPTTGMTSPLFGFVLAGAYLLGGMGERLVTFAVGIGVAWLGGSAWLTYRLASHLMNEESVGRGWLLIAAALVMLSGPVQWGCFNGMETGLFIVLTLAALEAFLSGRAGLCALWLGLAGLTRPEGLILAALVWMVTLVEGLVSTHAVHWRRLLFLSLAVLTGTVPFLINWVLTGTITSAGLLAKSWWFNVPRYPAEIVGSILLFYRRIVLGVFLGWEPAWRWFAPPGLLLFAVGGWAVLGIRRRWWALILTSSWFLVGTLSTATLITATWHAGRYQAPFMPVMVVLAVCGLVFLWRRAALWWQRALLGLVVLFLLVSCAYSTARFVRSYHDAVSTVSRQQLVLADWLRENLPAGVRVGVHDTGSLRYVGERPTYDLVGLTTAGAALPWRHGAGSVFEKMERSPMRPDYFAIYPDVFSIPYLVATDLFDEELFGVDVPDYAVASAGPVQGVWRSNWRLAGSGEQFYQPDVLARTSGLSLVDTLDVADLEDEAAHHVEWWQDVRRPGFPTEVWQLAYRALPEREVLDGGRLLTGGVAFDVATTPGEPLWIVARLHAQEAGAVRVEVDGRDVGWWAYPAMPGQWLETVFRAPAEAIAGRQAHVVLQVDTGNPEFRHYAPYYFWFLQGESEGTSVEIGHLVEATFDDGFSLLGFDLPEQVWRPGDVVPVTLYWQAAGPTRNQARVFLHLYDAGGNLVVQADGWAYYDTRPPCTWWPGEVVADPRSLALPVEQPAGLYSLEVGLYNPDGAGRLPAYRNGVRQREGRVPLAVLEVTE